ncbi:hypothetical protein KB206_10295 [Microvirga sp. STS02]|uniref:hypothetical protein n=1 Tax=Hymenobacter negativus TaxID=2795026 RepID=UPI0018DB3ABE|nr:MULTISPECIES: hypothetical protein [Bacteria]MBH8569275.1 hypothetical protein [Hymenobacter negativus]MBR7209010.1 hypothetical protein [Microvirga sp. STS02]
MMPRLVLFCLFLLAYQSSAQDWPRNPKTGKIEFRGLLPWPPGVRTEAQRQAKARQWYLKVTPYTAENLRHFRELKLPGAEFRTYAGLPNSVLWLFGEEATGLFVLYSVNLQPTPRGLRCIVSHLRWNSGRGVTPHWAGGELPEVPLEQVVNRNASLAYTIVSYRDKQNLPYFQSDDAAEGAVDLLRAEQITPKVDSVYRSLLANITNSPQQDVLENLRRRLTAAVSGW